jgi:hypothetical protein
LFFALAELREQLTVRVVGQAGTRTATATGDVGLVRLDLRNLTSELWTPVTAGQPACIAAALLGSDDTDEHVYGVVGFPSRVRQSTSINYYLTRMSWKRRSLRKLQRMPDVWF